MAVVFFMKLHRMKEENIFVFHVEKLFRDVDIDVFVNDI